MFSVQCFIFKLLISSKGSYCKCIGIILNQWEIMRLIELEIVCYLIYFDEINTNWLNWLAEIGHAIWTFRFWHFDPKFQIRCNMENWQRGHDKPQWLREGFEVKCLNASSFRYLIVMNLSIRNRNQRRGNKLGTNLSNIIDGANAIAIQCFYSQIMVDQTKGSCRCRDTYTHTHTRIPS